MNNFLDLNKIEVILIYFWWINLGANTVELKTNNKNNNSFTWWGYECLKIDVYIEACGKHRGMLWECADQRWFSLGWLIDR